MGTQLRSPVPKKGAEPPPLIFGPFYCGQTAACIKMPLSTEVGQSPGDFVLDGDPAPLNFRPMFIIVIVISLEHCISVIGLFKFKFKFSILCILFLESLIVLILSAMHSCATAPIAEVGVVN